MLQVRTKEVNLVAFNPVAVVKGEALMLPESLCTDATDE